MNLHSAWEFLNSPLFLTILTASIGGIVAAILSARWQKKSHVFRVRLDALQKLIELHSQWADGIIEEDQSIRFKLVNKLVAGILFLKAVFPYEDIQGATSSLIREVLDDFAKGNEKQKQDNAADSSVGKSYQALLRLLVQKLELKL